MMRNPDRVKISFEASLATALEIEQDESERLVLRMAASQAITRHELNHSDDNPGLNKPTDT